MTFNAEQAVCISGCSLRQLRYWRDTRLVQPACFERDEDGKLDERYDFANLVELRTIMGMLQKGVETVMRGLTGKTDRIERRHVFRMAVVLGLLGLAMVAVLIQAWRYQGPASQFLAAKARRQTTSSDSLSGNRGSIFDSSGRRILAVTVRNSTVTSTGGAWQDDWLMIANSLAVILEMPVEEVFRKVWDGIGKAVVIKKDVGDVEAAHFEKRHEARGVAGQERKGLRRQRFGGTLAPLSNSTARASVTPSELEFAKIEPRTCSRLVMAS